MMNKRRIIQAKGTGNITYNVKTMTTHIIITKGRRKLPGTETFVRAMTKNQRSSGSSNGGMTLRNLISKSKQSSQLYIQQTNQTGMQRPTV